MNKRKLMIITIGTSIFHSACWDKKNPEFKKKLGGHWEEYCEKFANPGVGNEPGGLSDPEKRRREGKNLENFFKDHLKGDDAGNWPEWVAPFGYPDSPAMRYSAEIATILRYAYNEAEEIDDTWQNVLEPYEFYFVYDSDSASLSGIAGLHNKLYLEKLLGGSTERYKSEEIQGFSSKRPKALMQALDQYQDFLNEKRVSLDRYETIEVVISGGYKIYGLIAYGFIGSPKFRIIYLHEEAEQVVFQDRESLKIENHSKRLFPAFIKKSE